MIFTGPYWQLYFVFRWCFWGLWCAEFSVVILQIDTDAGRSDATLDSHMLECDFRVLTTVVFLMTGGVRWLCVGCIFFSAYFIRSIVRLVHLPALYGGLWSGGHISRVSFLKKIQKRMLCLNVEKQRTVQMRNITSNWPLLSPSVFVRACYGQLSS